MRANLRAVRLIDVATQKTVRLETDHGKFFNLFHMTTYIGKDKEYKVVKKYTKNNEEYVILVEEKQK